jgi:hypothetical protein
MQFPLLLDGTLEYRQPVKVKATSNPLLFNYN